MSVSVRNTVLSLVVSAMLLSVTTGCATSPQVLLQEAGKQRIAIARPSFANHSIVLDALDGGYEVSGAYMQFCSVLKDELVKKGFTVVDYCSRRNTSYAALRYPVPAVGFDIDVILVPDVKMGYAAATNARSYVLHSTCDYAIIDARSREVLAVGRKSANDPHAPSHFFLTDLIADMDNAMAAVHRVAASLAISVGRDLK